MRKLKNAAMEAINDQALAPEPERPPIDNDSPNAALRSPIAYCVPFGNPYAGDGGFIMRAPRKEGQ